MTRRLLACAALLVLSPSAFAAHPRQPDFNGDGFADLAVGVPGETVGGHPFAGGVQVIYGSSSGLKSNGDQFFTQDTPGIADAAENGDFFGASLTWGDFDNDGFSDLAIGVLNESVNGVNNAGAVHVLYGSHSGLKTSGDQFWHRDVSGVIGAPQTNASFGNCLAAGDFDNDGRDDLAIGISNQTVTGTAGAGEIHVFYGSSHGITASGDKIFNEEILAFEDDVHMNEFFGSALTVGDFDGDHRDDLAVSALFDRVDAVPSAGAVYVIYGSSNGLTRTGAQRWTQESPGLNDAAEQDDFFGFSLAAGDFDNNGRDDLAIGIIHEKIAGVDVGAVEVIYGTSHGLDSSGDQLWNQDSSGVKGSNQDGQYFGVSVATGDFDHDGRDDLAIGVQLEDVGGINNAGAVNVLYGGSHGLQAGNDDYWTQDSPGIKDQCETEDQFGIGLRTGDYNGDGRDDLSIGVPNEDINGADSAGAVNVIYGSSSGLTSSDNQFWNQDFSGINDSAQDNDQFGYGPSEA